MRIPGSIRLWLIFALACFVALAYWPSAVVLLGQWSDFVNITYTHGWLVLAVCAVLVVHSRREIAAAPAAPFPAAMAALLAVSFAWLVCYRASIQDLHITIFPLLFWLAVTAAFGTRIGRLMGFPVVFFYFAVPSWSQLADPLQYLTVEVMRGFLAVTGPPALIDGPFVRIPNGTFVVEEGCSGLHFVIVGLAVAALHGHLQQAPWRTRVAQLALMAALALLANWLRVYTVIEAGYLTDMHHYLVSVSHYWFGWGVFALALVAFFWLSTWLPAAPPPHGISHDSSANPGPADNGLRGVAITAVLLLVLPGLSGAARRMHPAAAADAVTHIQPQAPWAFALGSFDSSWMPAFKGADASVHTVLESRVGVRVEVFAVSYAEQRQGAELVGISSSLLGPHLKLSTERDVDSVRGRFREIEALDPAGAHSLIWSQYEIDGRRFTSGLRSQLWYGLRATVAHPSAALVAARTECAADCDTARHTLVSLAGSGSLR
jgi:exosortase